MKEATKIKVPFDRFLDVLSYLAAALLGVLMLVICVAVFSRYTLHRPMGWVVEVSEFILLFVMILGMAWLLKEEGHVKMDILLVYLRPRPQALTNAITSALGAIILMTLTWYGLQDTARQIGGGIKLHGLLHIPLVSLTIPLAIGCFLFSIQFVRRSCGYLKSWRHGGSEMKDKSIDLSRG